MTDFGILCICAVIGYLARLVATNRGSPLAARLDAAEERLDAIEEAVFEEDDDGGPEGGEEAPTSAKVIHIFGKEQVS